MALQATVTPGYNFPDGQPVDNANFRAGASPTVSITGELSADQLGATAVVPSKVTAAAFAHGVDNGSTDAYAVTLTPAISAYADGMWLWFEAATGNTGAATLDVNGRGARTLKKWFNQDLEDGDIRAGQKVLVVYDSTNSTWQVASVMSRDRVQYAADTSGAADTIVVTLPIYLSAIPTGFRLGFKAANANTSASVMLQLTVRNAAENGTLILAHPVKKRANVSPEAGDIKAGAMVEVMFDGSQWQMLSQIGTAPDETAVVAAARNLVCRSATASTVTLTADELVLKSSTGAARLVTALNLTCDITAGGAGGLDASPTIPEAADTGYYIWVVWNGSAAAMMLSRANGVSVNYQGVAASDATYGWGPQMPTGYTHKGLVGYVWNDASGNLTTFRQMDRRVWYAPTVLAGWTTKTGVTVLTAASGSAVSTELGHFQRLVPSIAKAWRGVFGVPYSGSGLTTAAKGLLLAADVLSVGRQVLMGWVENTTQIGGWQLSGPFELPVTEHGFYYQMTDTLALYRVEVTGFEL